MERENIRFQSFYWLASLTRERHKHQPGLELPRWGAEGESLLSPLQVCFGGIRACWAHQTAARERSTAIKPRGETAREGWEGEAASVWGAWGSVLLKQKGTVGTPQRKNPSHLIRTTRIAAPEQLPYPSSVKILYFIGVTEIALTVSLC